MKNTAASTIAGVALIFTFASCSSLPEAQHAYNACTDSYNDKFRFRPGHKAMVSGVGSNTTTCYSSWSKPSTADAIARAMADCRQEYPRCFVYATDEGPSDWAKAISNSGGVSDSARRARANNDALTGVLSGVAAGVAAGSGDYRSPLTYGSGNRGAYSGGYQYTGGRQSYGGGSGRNNCPGATIAVDENCKPLH